MGIYLNPNNESFKMALNSQIYVDKTELIAYTNQILMLRMGALRAARYAPSGTRKVNAA